MALLLWIYCKSTGTESVCVDLVDMCGSCHLVHTDSLWCVHGRAGINGGLQIA